MSVHDSWKPLAKTAYGDTTPNDKVCEDGKNVVEALGCLALAVAQAGAYIRETSCPALRQNIQRREGYKGEWAS